MRQTHILKAGEFVNIPEWANKIIIEVQEETPEVEIKLVEYSVEVIGYFGSLEEGLENES